MSEQEKTICRKCKQFIYNRGTLYCKAAPKTLTHWSTGKKEVIYDECDHVNLTGECGMYVYQQTFWEWLKPILSAMNFLNWPCRETDSNRSM